MASDHGVPPHPAYPDRPAELAQVFYGKPAAPGTAPARAVASTVVSNPPDLSKFYPPDVALRQTFAKHRDRLFDVGFSRAEIAQHEREFLEAARAHRFNHDVSNALYDALADARERANRDMVGIVGQVEQTLGYQLATRQELRQLHGPARADQLIASVEKLVDAIPALKGLGPGSALERPDVFQLLTAHVESHPELVVRAAADVPDPTPSTS